MSYTYKLKGARWLRLYTAAATTPVYAAQSDAQAIADNLCDVPWTRADNDGPAMFPQHNSSTLDANVENRQYFDAAEFCAGHENGAHRVYANAAMYLFALPAAAQGVGLESVKVHVFSDPYNEFGARIAVHLLSTATLPTDCATVRSGTAHTEPDSGGHGAVPRVVQTQNNQNYWYAAEGDVTVELPAPSQTTAYLAVFVGLENYARSRSEWIEGASYIRNAVEITTSSAISGWTEGALIDCIGGISEFPVISSGVVPRLMSSVTGAFSVMRRLNGDAIAFEDATPASIADDPSAIGLHALYADLLLGRVEPMPPELLAAEAARPGVGFVVRRGDVNIPSDALGSSVSTPTWRMAASVLAVPFVLPLPTFNAIRLEWDAPTYAAAPLRVWLAKGQFIETPDAAALAAAALFTAAAQTSGQFALLGEADAGAEEAEFAVGAAEGGPMVATLLVSAFMPMHRIDLSSDGPHGTSSFDINPVAGTASGFDTLLVPDVFLARR